MSDVQFTAVYLYGHHRSAERILSNPHFQILNFFAPWILLHTSPSPYNSSSPRVACAVAAAAGMLNTEHWTLNTLLELGIAWELFYGYGPCWRQALQRCGARSDSVSAEKHSQHHTHYGYHTYNTIHGAHLGGGLAEWSRDCVTCAWLAWGILV